MIAALFILWTLVALVVGIVVGRAIAEADRREAARREAMRRHPAYIAGRWTA